MVSLLGEVPFTRASGKEATYALRIPDLSDGEFALQILFDATAYPIEQHCRYARLKDEILPRTFDNMEFSPTPPGIRLGPWPGWRGIPHFPRVRLHSGTREWTVELAVWGDETTQRTIRGAVIFRPEPHEESFLEVEHPALEPVSVELFSASPLQVSPVAVMLQVSHRDRHPRLLLDADRIVRLRKLSATTHSTIWRNVIALLEVWHLPFAKTPQAKTLPGEERLSGEDRVLLSALVAMIDPSEEAVRRAKIALQDLLRCSTETEYEPLSIDTQCGELLFVVCVAYDWLFNSLDAGERALMERQLGLIADRCWNHLGYERRDFAQAHYLGCGLGLLAYSLLFFEQHPRAAEWASYLAGVLRAVRSVLPDDGFYPHGINLWIYEYGFLLRWLELFRDCTELDVWGSADHWINASSFRMATRPDGGLFGVTFGDPQYRVGGDAWHHYLIASRTGSQAAQWSGMALADEPPAGVDFRNIPPRRRVYEFLFFDPAVLSQKPQDSIQVFEDGGQGFFRAGEEDPFLFTFRSGPPLGYHRYSTGIYGGNGHSDPANGAFLVFARNTLIASGPGPTYRRDTALHNTLTFDAQGQIGDGAVWLPDFIPPAMIPEAAEFRMVGGILSIAANLTTSYLPHLGVGRCTRSIAVLPIGVVIGVDVLSCRDSRTLEWNFHSWEHIQSHTSGDQPAFRVGLSGKEAILFLLEPVAYDWHIERSAIVPAYPHDGREDHHLRVTCCRKTARFVWWLSLDPTARVTPVASNNIEVVISVSATVQLRWDGRWLSKVGSVA